MRYFLNISIALLLFTGSVQQTFAKDTARRKTYDWTLIYHMSYDNDLDKVRTFILGELKKGVAASTDSIAVTVLVDSLTTDKLTQIAITQDGLPHETQLDHDNSASEEALEKYLVWAQKKYPARKYAIIFLNHGGALDDMSFDQNPGPFISKKWLSAKKTGPLLREFRKSVQADGSQVELVFLQQCGRGSIENLYNFHETGVAVMASQHNVGAPNTYYAATLGWLNPKASGFDLASKVMDEDKHFTSYVVVYGQALTELPEKIDSLISSLGKLERIEQPKKLEPTFVTNPTFLWESETNYDLLQWLAKVAQSSEVKKSATAEYEEFKKWIEKTLIKESRFELAHLEQNHNLSGISLFVPEWSKVREKYLDYPLYRESSLDDLMKALFPPVEELTDEERNQKVQEIQANLKENPSQTVEQLSKEIQTLINQGFLPSSWLDVRALRPNRTPLLLMRDKLMVFETVSILRLITLQKNYSSTPAGTYLKQWLDQLFDTYVPRFKAANIQEDSDFDRAIVILTNLEEIYRLKKK